MCTDTNTGTQIDMDTRRQCHISAQISFPGMKPHVPSPWTLTLALRTRFACPQKHGKPTTRSAVLFCDILTTGWLISRVTAWDFCTSTFARTNGTVFDVGRPFVRVSARWHKNLIQIFCTYLHLCHNVYVAVRRRLNNLLSDISQFVVSSQSDIRHYLTHTAESHL